MPNDVAFLAGRILLGGFFLVKGVNHFFEWELMQDRVREKDVPFPAPLVALTGLMLLAGGASILLGAYPLLGAALLMVFLLVVTPLMHNWWDIRDPDEQQVQLGNFMRNIGLLGGVLVAASVPLAEWGYALGMGF